MDLKKEKIAYMFTGQGSQKVGMGLGLFHLPSQNPLEMQKSILRELPPEVITYMTEGPDEQLQETENAQLAIVSHGLWLFSFLQAHISVPSVFLGHSLGEYSAWMASQRMSIDQGFDLLKKRAFFMQSLARKQSGGMLAVLKTDIQLIKESIKSFDDIWVANYNSPVQTILSGSREQLMELQILLKEKSIKSLFLNVAGAFHTPWMKEANDKLAIEIRELQFVDSPHIVYSNVTGEVVESGKEKTALLPHMESSVHFMQQVTNIWESGVRTFVEIGTGNILQNLVKQTLPEAEVRGIHSLEDVKNFI